MIDQREVASDREILAQTYEAIRGPSALWTGIIRTAQPDGHTSFIDVEIALAAMRRLRREMELKK